MLAQGPGLGFLMQIILAICLCATGTEADASGAEEVLVDRVVAVAEGRPILFSEIKTKVSRGPLIMVSDYPLEASAPVWDRAVQDAINFQLVIAKAKDLGIEIRDDEIEPALRGWWDSMGLSPEQVKQELAKNNTSYESYVRDFKMRELVKRFQGRVVGPSVKLTDKDIETYYMKKSGYTGDLVEVIMRQILIATPAGSPSDVLESKAKLAALVRQKVANGLAFSEAAKVYSDEPGARERGGLMPALRSRDLASAIRKEVEKLQPGEFTAPIKMVDGFHIFYLDDRRFSAGREFQAQKAQLEFELRTSEMAAQTRRWLAEQRQRSKVEILPTR